ncbi:hypothetical protein DTO10_26295 [Peribacillus butanolivorans]|uniref:Uncharacterized protein n=1 Tax=Peribacillus butanolivorans TaxID=421767 RepID=A0ABN5NAK8_9BACI|nr:hypothetical protein DTO10_26295 [Peribacillus butanolivorans]
MKINIEIFRDMVKKSKVSKKVQNFLRENGDPNNFLNRSIPFASNVYLLSCEIQTFYQSVLL